ncbi:MAG: hypothetical protein NT139_02315 [Candidatus Woesearchaeota archaeon]|nr:hypothetical protein [Candidatus Woesearchaeota archaeon]
MLQSLKNKGKILGLVGLIGISTFSGCITPNSGYNQQKMEQMIQESRELRNKAYSNRSYIPTRSGLYKSQDLSTVGEQNPDFKGMPLPDLETWEQRAERMKGRDNQPMGKAPWNVPPGYQNPHTK